MNSFAPVVLLIEDDRAVGRILRRRFNNDSTLAPLVLPDLKSAREFLEKPDLQISAILSDICFEQGTDDPEHNLNDGLDLLNVVQGQHPKIAKYILSTYAEEQAYLDKSERLGLDIHHWFPKLNFGDPMKEPWSQIERDLLKESLMAGGALAQEVSERGWIPDKEESLDNVLEWFRTRHKAMKFSFIQELPKDTEHYQLIKPIKVVCRWEDGEVIADALHLGLLNSGHGDDVEEAVDHLADLVIHLKEELDDYAPDDVVDYTAVVKSRLDQYIQFITPRHLS